MMVRFNLSCFDRSAEDRPISRVLVPLLVICCCCLLAPDTQAGKYNRVLSIGDGAPAWSELPGVDDAKHSLQDLKDKQAVVVVFTCNSCPYAVDVEERLIALQQDYSRQGVAVVAINVNTIVDDALPAMKEKAKAKKFTFAYLYDQTQGIGKAFGAVYTPEFYVLDGKRRVVYMGAMDDSPDGKAVGKTYVRDALDAVLAGQQPSLAETPAVGCRVRYERKRRTRKAP
jgi:thiol-disulfide isomerase/thioredoxin